ncbi:MAG: NAD(P)H-dependent oxidoreductase subunit E, partial [Pseudomonadota bacterium]
MDQLAPKRFERRDPSLPKGRQVSENDVAVVAGLLGDLERRADLVIEGLHLIQDAQGHITTTNMAAMAELFRMAQVEIFEVASFYHHFDIVREGEAPPPPLTIRVCDGLSCEMAGAHDLIAQLRDQTDGNVRIQPVPCIGRCAAAP